jgi:hypothetical protein
MNIRKFAVLVPLLTAAVTILLAVTLVPGLFQAPVQAQGASIPTITPSPVPSPTLPPTPNPTATAAAAFFTVERATIQSAYPDGIYYIFQATSSAGEIERVQVRSWTREGAATSSQLEWDDKMQAFVYYDRMFQPPWFEVSYQFRATDSAGNIYRSEEFTSEYTDPTRSWIRRENDHIIVLLFGARESLADDLFVSAADAMTALEEAHGFTLDYKPYVVVMPDQASFQEWQEYPDPYLAGVTYYGMGYTIQTLQWGEQDLIESTVPHELTHIFQGFIRDARDIPAWFTEGHATYFEPTQQYDYEQRVRDIANHPDFPTLQGDISLEYLGPDGRNRLAYDVGYTFITYWIDNYGWDSHRAFWQAQVTMNFEEAIEFATGKTLADLEAEWRIYLGAKGAAPTLIPSPTLMPFPTAPGMSSSG